MLEGRKRPNQATEGTAFVILLGALAALPPLSIDVSLPGLPIIARAINAPGTTVQQTLSAFIFAFGLGQLVVGPLSDRYGRRPTLLLGLAIFTVASLVCAISTNVQTLVLWRFVQGLGACAGTVNALAIVGDVAADRTRATTLQAYVSAVTAVAPIVAPLIGAVVLSVLGWRALYGVLVVIGLVQMVAVMFRLPETSPRVAQGTLAAYRRVLSLPRIIPLAVLIACGFGGYFALISASPSVLVTQFHLQTVPYAIAFAFNACALLTGSFIAGRLARRMETERLFAIAILTGFVAGVAVCVFNVFAPSSVSFVATMAAFAFTFGIANPSAYAVGITAAGTDAGVVAAVLGAMQMIGGAVGSATVGALGGLPSATVGVVVLVASVGTGLAYALSRRST